jgi:hypothetical protein
MRDVAREWPGVALGVALTMAGSDDGGATVQAWAPAA